MISNEVRACFGDARGYSTTDVWRGIEDRVGSLPAQYKEFCSAYGPGVVGKFLKVLHPESSDANMIDAIMQMSPLYHELYPEKIPCPPYSGVDVGAVLWAISVENDAFFLVPSEDECWKIGVWFRQWAEWEEYAEDVPEWLARQVTGDLVIPGIPLRVYGGFMELS